MNPMYLSYDFYPYIVDEEIFCIEQVRKKIIFFIHLSNNLTLSETDNNLLSKITQSINIKPEESDTIFGKELNQKDYDQLLNMGGFKYLFIFTDSITFQPINSDYYNFIDYNDTKILFSNSLSELQRNQELKMKLWKTLKSEFL